MRSYMVVEVKGLKGRTYQLPGGRRRLNEAIKTDDLVRLTARGFGGRRIVIWKDHKLIKVLKEDSK